MDLTSDSAQLDFRIYARALWRRKWIFLTAFLLVPVAVYVLSARSPKVFQASTLIQLQPTAIDTAAAQGGPSAQFIAIAARLIQTTGVAQVAARDMGLPRRSGRALLDDITLATDPNTGFITITAKANTPQGAARIANAFGAAVNTTRARQAVRQLNQQIAGIAAQIGALPPRAVAPRNQLIVQSERLQAARAAQGNNAQIIEPATPSLAPVSPHPTRNAALGALVGLLLGLALVAVAESLDRRVRQAEDLEKLGGLPLLTTVPREAFRGSLTPSVLEAFRNLRARLAFFNVDRDIRSIVIGSGRKGEGKTLVATNLARAYAYAGSDVILVDADLRRPMVSSRLGFESSEGLAEVLTGQCTVAEGLAELEVTGRETSRLRVLPAGEVPPNPAELLSSQRMHRLVEELSTMCDLVIMDTSPLLAVSDALPLLDRVSGVLLVARLGVVQRDELAELRRLLGASTSSSLGIVATGSTAGSAYMSKYAGYMPSRETVASIDGTTVKPSRAPALLGRRRR